MNPTFSVVIFTTIAGAAQGLIVTLALAVLAGLPVSDGFVGTALMVAEAMLLIGLGAARWLVPGLDDAASLWAGMRDDSPDAPVPVALGALPFRADEVADALWQGLMPGGLMLPERLYVQQGGRAWWRLTLPVSDAAALPARLARERQALAALCQAPSLMAERRFFFAQAQHPQNLYCQVVWGAAVPRGAPYQPACTSMWYSPQGQAAKRWSSGLAAKSPKRSASKTAHSGPRPPSGMGWPSRPQATM